MEFVRRISSTDGNLYVTACGSFDLGASVRAILDIANDPSFESTVNILVDLREMDYDLPVLDELEGISGGLETNKERLKGDVAVVCLPGPMRDLARLVCVQASLAGMRIREFTDFSEAQAWLGQSGPGGVSQAL